MPKKSRTQEAVDTGRRVQSRIDDGNKAEKKPSEAMQSGARDYPREFPKQHLRKHSSERDLELAPMSDAPDYRGSGKLDGRVALITGGSSGIGRAVAILFAREGADVAISYFGNKQDADDTREAVEAEGRRCVAYQGDIGDPQFCKQLVNDTMAEFGQLDILVNNAAFQQHVSDIGDLTDEQLDRTFRTNVFGSFMLTRAAVPHMRPSSAIIFTGSVVALQGSKELLDYSMTKGALHAFTRSLASHLVDRGIRVNCVAPGPVWTKLNPADRPAEDVGTFGQSTAMKRAAQPEEIAPAFVYLAAPVCSSYVTGEILPVIGGWN